MMALMIFQFSIIIVSCYGLQRLFIELNENKKSALKFLTIINLFLLILFFHNQVSICQFIKYW